MSLTPQQHADLSDHTYDRDKVGLGRLVDQRVVINGQAYLVLQHSDNPRTGYQGTIYQHFETGSILVAHRGTEFGREALRDGIIADGGMVLARTNSQAEDAIRLTNSALDHAKRYSSQYPTSIEVTTTGHSLGGTLAQISAHHFDLRGHTFNAYGAAQLDRRIPEGGSRVTNHVMAADAVSAASAHHGRVVIYATEREIASLRLAGYHNSRVLDLLQVDRPVAAAVANGGSHSMHNFLPVDGDGRPDVSVLAEPSMRQRAGAALIRHCVTGTKASMPPSPQACRPRKKGNGSNCRCTTRHLRCHRRHRQRVPGRNLAACRWNFGSCSMRRVATIPGNGRRP